MGLKLKNIYNELLGLPSAFGDLGVGAGRGLKVFCCSGCKKYDKARNGSARNIALLKMSLLVDAS